MKKSILSLSQFQTRVHDVIFSAEQGHVKSSELSAKFDKIRDEVYSKTTSGRARYDRWTQGAVCGMIQYSSNLLWEKMEFCYRNSDGIIFSTHKDSIRGCELANMECTHVWKGTDKPFTQWEIV